jgi:hypothetical protein
VIEFAWALLGAVFGAGVAYGSMRSASARTRADLNGVGKKYGRLVSLLIEWADTPEKRAQLARAVEPR